MFFHTSITWFFHIEWTFTIDIQDLFKNCRFTSVKFALRNYFDLDWFFFLFWRNCFNYSKRALRFQCRFIDFRITYLQTIFRIVFNINRWFHEIQLHFINFWFFGRFKDVTLRKKPFKKFATAFFLFLFNHSPE